MIEDISINDIIYKPPKYIRQTKHTKSIEVIGMDTETLNTGKCFMIATSLPDVFKPDDIPQIFFTRKYRSKRFVVFNIKFDEGSILQHLPRRNLEILRETNKTTHKGYTYISIPRKLLKITHKGKAIEIYDVAGFYGMSLENAAQKYLGKGKIEMDTKSFSPEYVKEHWNELAEYCIMDATLTKELADLMINKFEYFGVYPQRLYSTAYISFQYFKSHCDIPLIKNIYDNHKPVLQYALSSYNGGKFEVTEKGIDYYYLYDIISAYSYEIANLVDIQNAYVVHDLKYRKGAVYGFLYVKVRIFENIYSPLPIKKKTLNIYPIGYIQKYITKQEYEYLISIGCEVKILDAYWLFVGREVYPFRSEIKRLIKYKEQYKREHKDLDYETIKIFLNSLYGKFVQLIPRKSKYWAGINWNIIYGSVITANCRIRISEMQQSFKSVVAVHTDSVISTKKLPFGENGNLGDFVFKVKGNGLVLGSGIYQIGDYTKFRGFTSKIDLINAIEQATDKLEIIKERPYTWREVIFHGWDTDLINRFQDISKKVNVDFDQKRIWIEDWKTYQDVLKRKVYSVPIPVVQYWS